jgi:hypothetical protein
VANAIGGALFGVGALAVVTAVGLVIASSSAADTAWFRPLLGGGIALVVVSLYPLVAVPLLGFPFPSPRPEPIWRGWSRIRFRAPITRGPKESSGSPIAGTNAARLLVLAELETTAERIEMVRLTRPEQYSDDFSLPTTQWLAQRQVFANSSPRTFEVLARAYKAIQWVNDALAMRKARSGATSTRFAVIDDDRLDRAETETVEAIRTLKLDRDADVNIAKESAPLHVRHEQREPYTTARFPGRPPDVHSVGIYNPRSNPVATHVRIEIVGMDPLPRNARGAPAEFPAIVPMKRGGDPRVGLTLNPDTEEIWDIATASSDGGGNLFVQGIASAHWPLGSRSMWDFQRDERWRLRYQASADNLPTTAFTIVMEVVNGLIHCQLEGS